VRLNDRQLNGDWDDGDLADSSGIMRGRKQMLRDSRGDVNEMRRRGRILL